MLQQAVQVGGIRADSYQADGSRLPDVVVVNLGHGDIELLWQALEQGPDDLALFFKGMNTIELYFEDTGGYQHGWQLCLTAPQKTTSKEIGNHDG